MTQGNLLPTKILVKKIEKKEKVTTSGIFIPSTVGKDPNISGDVILTGTGTETVQMCVKEGDRVLFNPHSFQTVRIDEVDYLLLDVRDVLYWFRPDTQSL
jgi:co-chaperonin GroES (HSP10)